MVASPRNHRQRTPRLQRSGASCYAGLGQFQQRLKLTIERDDDALLPESWAVLSENFPATARPLSAADTAAHNCQTDEFRKRPSAHSLHQNGTMVLDRPLADTE
jgi:hypothetical protein